MCPEPLPALLALWHPGSADLFSGYGLALAPLHLVGLVLVDRPRVVDPQWLARIEAAFGDYQLVVMSSPGHCGLVCQMHITPTSAAYLRPIEHALTPALIQALAPLLDALPAVVLHFSWDPGRRCWVSESRQRRSHAT